MKAIFRNYLFSILMVQFTYSYIEVLMYTIILENIKTIVNNMKPYR